MVKTGERINWKEVSDLTEQLYNVTKAREYGLFTWYNMVFNAFNQVKYALEGDDDKQLHKKIEKSQTEIQKLKNTIEILTR